MLMDYSSKSVHIQDMGLFPELALTLSASFGRVTYTSPWANSFPSSKDTEIGEGMSEITRVDDIHEVIDETDLFVFPDCYLGPLQDYLVGIKKRVYGSRNGDELEIYRDDAKSHFKELGIPQGPYEVITGIDELRKYLQANDEIKHWVKIPGKNRGETESFPVDGYELTKNKLDQLESRLGPEAKIMVFVVEEHQADTIDLAIDTQCADGAWPSVALLGTEEKGEVYICVRKAWKDMPPGLVSIYEALSPDLKEYEYRNFISLESRAKNNVITLSDPCQRWGSPPGELQLNMITNLPDIMWFGAEGKVIDPEIPSRYGVELIIHSDWSAEHPLMVDYPKEMRNRLKFRYCSEFDGKTWIMPQNAGPRIAAIVEHGDSLENIIGQAEEDSSKLRGIQIEAFTRSFPIALDKIKTLQSWGLW